MKGWITGAVKKITLEAVYEIIDERTKEIKKDVEEIRHRQEEDFRYINQKIDSQTNQVRQEINEVRQEIGQLNQRIDTVIGLLVDISKQKSA